MLKKIKMTFIIICPLVSTYLIISLICLIDTSCSAYTEKEMSSVVTNLIDESKKDTIQVQDVLILDRISI